MQLYSKHIFLPDKEVEGYLTWENGKITKITSQPEESYTDYRDFYIFPGYIDNHLHGWACGSFWQEGNASSIYRMKEHLPKTGVTSFLATTGADSKEWITSSLLEAKKVLSDQKNGSEMIGVHMEGPFINKKYKGMQKEECCIDSDVDFMKELMSQIGSDKLIYLMTMAPELQGSKELIQWCHTNGIVCQIGHSDSDFETISKLKDYGLKGVTHMFSGMRGFHHRELGVVGAALYYDDLFCEFAKQTGMTVNHEAFDIVYRLKGSDKILLTTDCVGYACVREPFYHYVRKEKFIPCENGLLIQKDDGTESLIDRNDYEKVKHLEMSYNESVVEMAKHSKVTPFDVMKMTSLNPAQYIGISDKKGSLLTGYDADIIVCDTDYHLIHTYCKGIQCY